MENGLKALGVGGAICCPHTLFNVLAIIAMIIILIDLFFIWRRCNRIRKRVDRRKGGDRRGGNS